MKRRSKSFIAVVVAINMCLPYGAQAETISKGQSVVQASTNSNIISTQSQTKFPEDNPTSRVYAKSRTAFKAYKGRGTMVIHNHGAKSAEVYVNGSKININKALKNSNNTQTIDIGRYTQDGENLLKVVNVSPDGSYIDVTTAYPKLIDAKKPEDAGFSGEKLSKVDELINSEVKAGFPGAVLIVVKDGKIVKNTAYGYAKEYENSVLLPENKKEKMTTNTMFDLASNTKMFATNFALQKLVSEGKIKVDDLVTKYIPDFSDGDSDAIKGKANIKISDLLNHCAGFTPDPQYFNPVVAKELFSQDRETTLKMLAKTPLVYETGSKVSYSDVDYMLLGYIIEKITGVTQDKYVSENIYKPLGLNNTTYNPLKNGFTKEASAATELNGNTRDGVISFPNVRTDTLQGEVHDEKAFYSMGGVSGHAGLFSNTRDMAILAQTVLNGGGYGSVQIFDKITLDQFTKTSDISSNYGLGWDKAGAKGKAWEFGPYASPNTIGHTGWTGTVTNIDKANDMAVILLTNKKHSPLVDPKKNPNAFKGDAFETGQYGSIMSLVYEALLEKTQNNNSKNNSEAVTSVKNMEASQIDIKFPEDNATSRAYARYRRSFKGYEGKGTMTVENNGATSAQVYVNGVLIDISKVLHSANGKATIDIGKYTVDGENTLKVLNVTPDKSYLNIRIAYPELTYDKPEDVGFSLSKLAKVDTLINSEVKAGFPGATLIVVKNGKIVKNTAYGYAKEYENSVLLPEDKKEKMTTDTMFDLASNTKMFATNFALQKLVSEDKIKVDDLVTRYIPDFKDADSDPIKGKVNIKIRDLLNHCAGFTPDPQYFNKLVAKDLFSQDRETTLKMLEKTPLVYETGSKVLYSDVDYMLLGYIIEKITGVAQDKYVSENIYKPLGLNNTTYNPLKNGFSKEASAATELNGNTRDGVISFENVRTDTLQGEVHDEKAYYSMGGVSGHAGLFSNTKDMAVLAQTVLNGGGYGSIEIFDKNTLDEFTKTSDISSNYGLGWDKAGASGKSWEFGPYASPETIGHTGWTGTVTCIDPVNDMAIILLTNKKHSPLIDPKKNANSFKGDIFETGQYGSVMSLVYEALYEKGNSTDTSTIQAASDKIKIAEKSFSQLDLDEANALMNLVPSGKDKANLAARIKVVQDTINLKSQIVVATSAVVKAENSIIPEDISAALALVNALPDGSEKTALIARINAAKERKIKLGIDNIDNHKNIFANKKVGLITNPSGINSNFVSSIDILKDNTSLVALFAAEHGIRGNSQDGGTIENEIDVKTGLPVYSLYGKTKKPTPDMLKDIDVLAYDMQDVGARFYTFINTMAYAMQACAENDKTFAVFDRPNIVSGAVQGTILNMDFKSFVGMYPIPQRYGMTVGELANFINKEYNINCKLEVIPMTGWTRNMYYDETGSKTWVMPSPNMPTLDTAIVYTGTCVFEGTNLSEGRGTTRPFELIGAPYVNSIDLADKLNSLNLPGAKFRATFFTPTISKYSSTDTIYNTTGKAEACGGVQLYVTDRNAFNSVKTGLAMLYTIRDMYPDDFKYTTNNYMDLLTGDSYVREGKYTLQQLFERIDKESEEFKSLSEKYYLYK